MNIQNSMYLLVREKMSSFIKTVFFSKTKTERSILSPKEGGETVRQP